MISRWGRPGSQATRTRLQMTHQDAVGVRIETLALPIERRRLRETGLEDVSAKVLPTIDHMPMPNPERVFFFDGDGPGIGPRTQLQRREGELRPEVMLGRRFGTDAGTRATPDLIAETRTPNARLEPQHTQTQALLTREIGERGTRLAGTRIQTK